MNNKIINIFSNRNQNSLNVKENIKQIFEKLGYSVEYFYNPNAILNICIGGDGSFLKSVHRTRFSSIPFIGINTGHLGFFQEVKKEEIEKLVYVLENKKYKIDKIYLLETSIKLKNRKEFTYYALNEFLIKSTKSHMIQLDMYIDDFFIQKHIGDGLLITSPSGSTGHNASFGGPILYQTLNAIAVTPMAPITSNTYRTLRNSIILPQSSYLKVSPSERYSKTTLLVVDGEEKLQNDIEYFNIKLSQRYIRKISINNNWYWQNLKEKFL